MRILCLFVILAVSACTGEGIPGSGTIIEEKREIGAFTQLRITGPFGVIAAPGEKESLRIQGDDNLLPLINTRIKGDALIINTTKKVRPSDSLKITLTFTRVNKILLEGGNLLDVQGLNSPSLDLHLVGAGSANITGKVEDLDAKMDGAGHLNLKELIAKNARVVINGAGSADFFASESMDAQVIGVGTINCYGNPEKVKQQVTGIGAINFVK